MRSALYWNFTQHRVVIPYQRFGTTYQFHLQGLRRRTHFSYTSWPSKMGPTNCPETSVWSYHSMLRKIPVEHKSHLRSGGSLKSCKIHLVFMIGVTPWRWWWLTAKTCRRRLILYIYIYIWLSKLLVLPNELKPYPLLCVLFQWLGTRDQ